ncbi:MAG: LysM domain-containing protein [Oculatellaceae cyanobacterium Prado106]|nr:LysM domain-containing protein [Oculatellaceae cyanobacterium Prado106]
MALKITCPVCDRPEVEGDCCPNCETDLSLTRMLMDLPVVATEPLKKPRVWWQTSMAILFMALGIGMVCAGNAIVSSPTQPSVLQTAAIASKVTPLPVQQKTCGGFYYTVRSGDGISDLAWQFYGSSDLSPKIIEANPQLKERPDFLQIDEVILIPNREESCL